MHILVISSSYSTKHDGSEAAGSFVNDFVLELSKFTKVTVVTPGEKTQRIATNNIIIYSFKVPRLPLSLLNFKNPSNWLSILRTLYLGFRTTKFLIQNHTFSHVLCFWVIPSGIWAYMATRKSKDIPYSCWALGSDIWQFEKNAITRKIVKYILDSSYKCFADGIKLKDVIEKKFDTKCEFLPSCRNISPIVKEFSSDGTNLAFLGRWHHNKGIDLLLSALDLLSNNSRKKISEVRIAGGGPLSTLVHSKCKKLIESKFPISVFGYLDIEQAAELITWADYLIIPSRLESIPVILSDAIQCNTPVIAMPAGDLEDIINKYNIGILAENINARALKVAIESALETTPSLFFPNIIRAKELFSVDSSVQTFLNAVKE